MEIRPTYLVMITAENNNKYYNCFPNGDTFTVKYGRVGGHESTTSYSISKWDAQINSKIKKGYVDRTDLMQEVIEDSKVEENVQDEYKGLKGSIAKIIKRLQEFANNTIKASYRVTASVVTQAMVDKAQDKIDFLSSLVPQDVVDGTSGQPQDVVVGEFNNNLIELFEIIPRKMSYVPDNLAKKVSDFAEIVNREQSLLDTMAGQIYQKKKTQDVVVEQNEDTKDSILNKMGIAMDDTDDKDVEIIKELLGNDSNRFVQAWRVSNTETQKNFDSFCNKYNIKNTKLLWHGSRNENFLSIMKMGLRIRPSNAVYTGSMFSDGCYFSPLARKSIGYSSVSGSFWAKGNSNTGFMAIFEVAYGNPYIVYEHTSECYHLNFDVLQKKKPSCHCLYASPDKGMLRNPEIVFYRTDQMTIKYLVEIK